MELIRRRLLDRLAADDVRPIALVVAAAGSGKSTLLRQLAANDQAGGRRIHVAVGSGEHLGDPEAVVRRLERTIGVTPTPGTDLADRAIGAIRTAAPTLVVLALDDVDQLEAEDSRPWLAAVVSRLPANGRLVLAGRCRLRVPLARRWAADEVEAIGPDDLRLSPAEVAMIVQRAGRPPGSADGVDGWPSLVQLAVVAPPGTDADYLRDEVVATLAPADRTALLALAVAGRAPAAVLDVVVGAPVDAAQLVERVPLLRLGDAEDRTPVLHAHALWTESADRVFGSEVIGVRRQMAPALAAHGDVVGAGELALAVGDVATFCWAARELVRTTLSLLPLGLARRWLRDAPHGTGGAPELALLAIAVDEAAGESPGSIQARLDVLAEVFAAAQDDSGEAAALSLGFLVALTAVDIDGCHRRGERLAGLTEVPLLTRRVIGALLAATMAELAGHPDAGADRLAPLVDEQPGSRLARALARPYVNALVLAGRADEAVAVADRELAGSPHAHARLTAAFVRWQAGDPSGLVAIGHRPVVDAHDQDRFRVAAFGVIVRASLGQAAEAARAASSLGDPCSRGDPREVALVAMAWAAAHVVAGDEVAAAAVLADARAGCSRDASVLELHLRRFPALTGTLAPDLAQRWRTGGLGPCHRRALVVADALAAARATGRVDVAGLDAGVLVGAVPLPWAVEVIVGRWRVDPGDAIRLATDLTGPSRHDLRAALERHGDAGAALMAALGRATAASRVELRVLGPMRIEIDGDRRDVAQLRRRRVRELLALLVVEPVARRQWLVDQMWPELDPDAANANFRVTLSHARRALQLGGLDPILADGSTVRLVAEAGFDVDVWQIERALRTAAAARVAGDDHAWAAAADAALAHWCGEPLEDLVDHAAADGPRQHLSLALIDVALARAELALTTGDGATAARRAEQVVAADPFHEAGHRVLVAAHLDRRDHRRATQAAQRLVAALDDLGVQPEATTRALLRVAAGGRACAR